MNALKWTVLGVLCLVSSAHGGTIQYVIHISVDGGGSSYIQNLVTAGSLPNFQRFQTQGAWTNNARNDYDYTVTLPNHTSMVTGRGVLGVSGNGHMWTSNTDPAVGQTIQSNKGSYVAGIYDVAHDNGLRTAMYATKTKFSLFDTSYNATNGALDLTGTDNGRDKIDTYVYNSSSTSLLDSYTTAMNGATPYNFSFVHFTDPDTAGHASGWGSTAYNNSLIAVDGYVGQIFNMVTGNATLNGHTAIVLTADHGGYLNDHSDPTLALDYTIPLYVWGPGVTAGADLYSLNPLSRTDPGTARITYSATGQPIRNGDSANLELMLLGLGAVPGSTINTAQDLAVPEPATMLLLAAGMIGLCRRSRR